MERPGAPLNFFRDDPGPLPFTNEHTGITIAPRARRTAGPEKTKRRTHSHPYMNSVSRSSIRPPETEYSSPARPSRGPVNAFDIPTVPEPIFGTRSDFTRLNRFPTGGNSKRINRRMKTKKCKNDATFVWLNLWFKTEFEKLGWMLLAQKKGYDEKVNAYINSVQRLYDQLECKIKDTKDYDRKKDLMIMYKDVKILIDHIHKDF